MLSIIESTSASPTDPLDSGLSQCSGGPNHAHNGLPHCTDRGRSATAGLPPLVRRRTISRELWLADRFGMIYVDFGTLQRPRNIVRSADATRSCRPSRRFSRRRVNRPAHGFPGGTAGEDRRAITASANAACSVGLGWNPSPANISGPSGSAVWIRKARSRA